jgi:acetoin utilization deacetylase AcuC-like enzyme
MHPERPDRIPAIERELEGRAWLGLERREAPRAERALLEAVHPPAYVDRVEEYCARGAAFDADTPTSPGSWEASLRAAGAAGAMAEVLMAGDAPYAFCGLRPPGHHAERERAMGFCLFANVSIAARRALQMGAERVFVLDWDVHHGNGTEAIWWSSPEVLFASLHQWPFYPGTGALGDVGEGDGRGFTVNLPMPAGSGEEEWLPAVEHVALPAARAFGPGLILISAGYDAHRDDPLADCLLGDRSYAQMTLGVLALANELGVPVGVVLEGGYDLGALARSTAATLEALRDGGAPEPSGPTPLTEAAAEQVGRYWDLAWPT